MALSLQEISDRFEIQDLCYQYADIIDRCGKQQCAEELRDIFTEDAHIDYSPMGGVVGGVDEVINFINESLQFFREYQHLNANIQLTIEGDTATGRVMCFNPMELAMGKGETQTLFMGLWYKDKYIRTAKGWRIVERVEEKSWSHNIPESVNNG